MQPWRNLDEATTKDGKLVLRQRGERDFLLTIDGRVLMSSMLHRSEDSLAKLAFERIATLPKPRVLTAGLGLGFTLRALLDVLPRGAHVEVAELHEVIVRWCEGPLAPIHQHATSDPRVSVKLGDVMNSVRAAALDDRLAYDAIVLDLMEGPSQSRAYANGLIYGPRALESVKKALAPGGVYAVWGEEDDPTFLDKLMHAGFDARRVIVGKGGPRHVVYIAMPATAARSYRGVVRGGVLGHGGPDAPVEEEASPRRKGSPPASDPRAGKGPKSRGSAPERRPQRRR